MPRFLIICPTFNHADSLFIATASARAQQIIDWEMVIIGDGAPERTDIVAREICSQDPRISYLPHPKAPRYGEPYRDPVIRQSNAEFICHLGDDDIWAPNHLNIMAALLADADLVNQAALRVLPNGSIDWMPVNQATPAVREATLDLRTVSGGLNYVAYRRAAYLSLPEGWTSAPWEAGQSDQFMWAKFLRQPQLQIASTADSGALKLPSHTPERFDATPEYRVVELAVWLAKIGKPGFLNSLRERATVQARLSRLLAIAKAGTEKSWEEGLQRAGFRIVESNVQPRHAANGDLMDLPLTQSQITEVQNSWQALRTLVERAADEQTLVKSLGSNRATWIKTLHLLNQDHPEAAQLGARIMSESLSGSETHALALQVVMHVRAGHREKAQSVYDDIPLRFLDHGEVLNAFQVLSSSNVSDAGKPWQKQSKPVKAPE